MDHQRAPPECTVWMGNVESAWSADQILGFFHEAGHKDALSVDRPPTADRYCFVAFRSPDAAADAKHDLHGRPIPGHDRVLWKLNVRSDRTRDGGVGGARGGGGGSGGGGDG